MILNNSYKQEIEISNAMMHEKSFIQNFHYKIAHDQNFSVFFKSLMEKSAEVDSMSAYDFAVFKREVNDVYDVLRSFEGLLFNSNMLSGKTGDEIAEPCIVFTDYVGQGIMKILGYMPLFLAVHSKVSYLDLFKKYSDKEGIESSSKRAERALFNRKYFGFRTFPNERHLVDLELRNRKIDFEKEHYESEARVVLDATIDAYSALHKENKDTRELLTKCGIQYWDAKQSDKQQKAEEFAKVISAIADGISKPD
ncbi:hypothetical protein KW882_00535 [Vibrio parahaemolyticus]